MSTVLYLVLLRFTFGFLNVNLLLDESILLVESVMDNTDFSVNSIFVSCSSSRGCCDNFSGLWLAVGNCKSIISGVLKY